VSGSVVVAGYSTAPGTATGVGSIGPAALAAVGRALAIGSFVEQASTLSLAIGAAPLGAIQSVSVTTIAGYGQSLCSGTLAAILDDCILASGSSGGLAIATGRFIQQQAPSLAVGKYPLGAVQAVPAVTVSATGQALASGTLAASFDADLVAASGASLCTASAVVTSAGATLSALAGALATGSCVVSGSAVVAGYVTVPVTATGLGSIGPATVTAGASAIATGSFVEQQPFSLAIGKYPLGAVQVAPAASITATGQALAAGTLVAALDTATISATAIAIRSAIGAATFATATVSGSASAIATGTCVVAGSAVVAGYAAAVDTATGVGSIGPASVSVLGRAIATGTFVEQSPALSLAVGAAPLGAIQVVSVTTVVATGQVLAIGTLAASLDDCVLSASAIAPKFGQLTSAWDDTSVIATGAAFATGAVVVQFPGVRVTSNNTLRRFRAAALLAA